MPDVARRSIGRGIRALRRRRGWRQRDLAAAAGISQTQVSRIERDQTDGVTLRVLRGCVAALEGYLAVDIRWRGEALDFLTDADHAALQEWAARALAEWGWEVLAEVSFNHYGDRGRIDLLAFHAASGCLAVIEIKSRIEDAQDTLGRLDIKVRLAPGIGRERGWLPTSVVAVLLVADDRTSQRRVADHPALFARFALRGRSAIAWLRRPRDPAPAGLLAFIRAPAMRQANRDPR
jgi:transcriptional regulator with XRE-family HTH domain